LVRKKRKSTTPYIFFSLIGVVIGGLVLAALTNHPSGADAAQGQISDRSRICMLQDTVQAKSGITYVYSGKKYFLCCGGCLAGFQQDPAIHSHATDPVDGKSVDKADAPAYAYQGRAYFFSSAANMTKFANDPGKFVTNASSQSPRDE